MTSDKVSDTPRTDRVARGRSEIASPTVVDVEFARGLERELAALRAAPISDIRQAWREEALRYAQNADYWRERYNALRAAQGEPVAWRFPPDVSHEDDGWYIVDSANRPSANRLWQPLYAAPADSAAPVSEEREECAKLLEQYCLPYEGESVSEGLPEVLRRAARLLRAPQQQGEPVAWRVRDFGDGWILCHSLAAAEREGKDAGCLIQPLYTAPPDSAARIAELEEALREVRDREARNRAPWTHEAAADEYSRMLACDRDTARRALATNSRKEGEGK